MKHAHTKKKYCKKCGYRVPNNARRCPHCGAKTSPVKKHPALRIFFTALVIILVTTLLFFFFCRNEQKQILEEAQPASLESILSLGFEDPDGAREHYEGNDYIISGFVGSVSGNSCTLQPSGGSEESTFTVYLNDEDMARVNTGAPITVIGRITEAGMDTVMKPAFLK